MATLNVRRWAVIIASAVAACSPFDVQYDPFPEEMKGCYFSEQGVGFVVEGNKITRLNGEFLANVLGVNSTYGQVILIDEEVFASYKYGNIRPGRNIDIHLEYADEETKEIRILDPDKGEMMVFKRTADSEECA